jgi:hypothetical protein
MAVGNGPWEGRFRLGMSFSCYVADLQHVADWATIRAVLIELHATG